MGIKSNQHYVPQFYFRFFSRDGKSICALNRKTGIAVERAPIKSQASRNYFYGDAKVEDALSTLEGIYSSALKQLKDSLSFSSLGYEEYLFVLQSLVLQKSRTLAARNKSKPMHDKLAKLHAEVSINNATDLSEEEKEQLLTLLDGMVANPQQSQGTEMVIALENAGYLADLRPLILVNKTNRPFIFSDAPVVMCNHYCRNVKLRGVLGYRTPGLQLFFPLGPSHMLALVDPETYRVKGVRDDQVSVRSLLDVANLNKLQLHNAASTVYFSDFRHAIYVKGLWEEENKRFQEHVMKVIEAPSFDRHGEPMGAILHCFESQLPVKLTLSFLEHVVIGDGDYRSARRSSGLATA
jgi:hypothetical protein